MHVPSHFQIKFKEWFRTEVVVLQMLIGQLGWLNQISSISREVLASTFTHTTVPSKLPWSNISYMSCWQTSLNKDNKEGILTPRTPPLPSSFPDYQRKVQTNLQASIHGKALKWKHVRNYKLLNSFPWLLTSFVVWDNNDCIGFYSISPQMWFLRYSWAVPPISV